MKLGQYISTCALSPRLNALCLIVKGFHLHLSLNHSEYMKEKEKQLGRLKIMICLLRTTLTARLLRLCSDHSTAKGWVCQRMPPDLMLWPSWHSTASGTCRRRRPLPTWSQLWLSDSHWHDELLGIPQSSVPAEELEDNVGLELLFLY